jgi:hypothetical protein
MGLRLRNLRRDLVLIAAGLIALSVAFPWFRYPGDEFGPACDVAGVHFGIGILVLVVGIAVGITGVLLSPTRILGIAWLVVGLGGSLLGMLMGPQFLDQDSINAVCGSAFRFAMQYGAEGSIILLAGSALLLIVGVFTAIHRYTTPVLAQQDRDQEPSDQVLR